MSDMTGDLITPLPVTVVGSSPVNRDRLRSVYRVITLTTTDNAEQALPQSFDRVCAYIQGLDDNICVASNQSDASAGSGAILKSTNTAPWPIDDHGAVYVAAPTLAGTTSRVSVTATYRVKE